MEIDDDPRLSDTFVRNVPAAGSDADVVVVVGVVHDHPASAFRVKSIVESVDPDVLALELPPLALPLYERYAADERTPPRYGGEFSTAIQAADGAVVGIDGPSARFVVTLLRALRREPVTVATTRKVFRGLRSVTEHAIACRLAAVSSTLRGAPVEVGSPVVHDCEWDDDPRVLADDERAQVRRARAVASVFGTPDAVSVRDATREEHMADRLAQLRTRGDVVAVVGQGHLAPLVERLEDAG